MPENFVPHFDDMEQKWFIINYYYFLLVNMFKMEIFLVSEFISNFTRNGRQRKGEAPLSNIRHLYETNKAHIGPFPRSAHFVVNRVWCGGKYDYRGLWVKNTHPESCRNYFSCCLRDRMSESVGGDVGALKPQQVGKNDRFTSPCSYGLDILSGNRHTAVQRYK